MMHSIRLTDPQQGLQAIDRMRGWVRTRLQAGKTLRLTIGEEQRSLPQNALIQTLVRSIGTKLDRHDHDRLRLLLVELWRTETKRPVMFMPSLDGLRMVDVSNSTSALDKNSASEFVDWLIAKESELLSKA
jgi:hypothetical protein